MDVQTLSNLFAATVDPNPNVRKAAELEIRRVGPQEGMLGALIQLVGSEPIDITTRQACAVYLKNRVQRAYFIDPSRPRPDQTPIPQSDRLALKQHILPLLISVPSRPIRVQIAHTFKTLVSHDFPDNWPNLLDEITALLNSNEPRQVYGGLVAHLEVIKACRFRLQDDLVPSIAPKTFPTLATLGAKFAANPSLESAEYLHIIIKTYHCSTRVSLSAHQQSPASIVPWGTLLFQVVNMQSETALPGDDEEKEKSSWWKSKKWAYRTLNRLFDRYGNPSQLPAVHKKEYGEFANHFVSAFAPEIFQTYLKQVELYIGGQSWLSQKCLNQVYQFFTSCVKPKSTWQLLKPHVETLISQFIFPQLCFNARRQELWSSDPVEYVRISIDEYEDDTSPSAAATSLLLALALNRKSTAFMPILSFINTVVGGSSAPEQKFGALNMTVALGGAIMKNPTVKPAMENFLLAHVLPEFSSPHGYLRTIACELVGTFERFEMEWAKEENLASHFRALAAALDDPELAVRVSAVLSLTYMIRHKSVHEAMSPGIGKVMQDLFKLSDETDLDMLNDAMTTFIESFQEELLPVSAELTTRLCEQYTRLLGEHAAAQGDDTGLVEDVPVNLENDKTFALMGVAKTLQTIITALASLEDAQTILTHVQELVVPIVKLTFEQEAVDLFDAMFDLVDTLTFTLRQIPASMWIIYELTYKLFKTNAIDFLDEMLPSLDNFISYGKEMFFQRPDYRQMAVDIYTTALTSDQLGENDRVNGCKLAESLLLNLRGHIDDVLPSILSSALNVLATDPRTKSLRLAALEVVINAVLYNPALTLQILEAQGSTVTRGFFDKWFVALKSEGGLPRVHDKKLSIFALCALLELDNASVPPSLHEGWAGIVAGVLGVFKGLPTAVARREALIEAYDPNEDEDDADLDDVAELEMADNDDADVWDEDSAYLELLANEAKRLREKSGKRVDDGTAADDETLDSSDDDSVDEELGFETPLDSADPYLAFKRALTAFQAHNPAAYQSATTSLDVELQTIMMEAMAQAGKAEEGAVPSQ